MLLLWKVAQHTYSAESYPVLEPEKEGEEAVVDAPAEVKKKFDKEPFYKFIDLLESLVEMVGTFEKE